MFSSAPSNVPVLSCHMSGNRRKRLEKLEQTLNDLITQEALVNCICLKHMFVGSRETFLMEANKTCPVHGFRRLRSIVLMTPGRNNDQLQALTEAVKEYRGRLAEVEQTEDEKEYGWEER
jgi:hypothetical protein